MIFIYIALTMYAVFCVIVILLVLVTSSKSGDMGLFSLGGGQGAGGSNTVNPANRLTSILVVAFFIVTFGLAIWVSKSGYTSVIEREPGITTPGASAPAEAPIEGAADTAGGSVPAQTPGPTPTTP